MFTCQKMATHSEKAFSVLEFHSIKPIAILHYGFKTVASSAQRKVKAGRLLVQKQLEMLGGSFGCFVLSHSCIYISQQNGRFRHNVFLLSLKA